jgi:dTDP-4-amino-4,6-dideoxygalactose transaminase
VLLRRRPIGGLPEPLDDAKCRLYFKGRNAVWHAVSALKPLPGETILVPSYHCGAELDAILKAGAKVEFYRVDRSARIDLQHLAGLVSTCTRAVFIIHYFGFPDPRLADLLALCRSRNLLVIEDCAHALYSRWNGQFLGTLGSISAFSLFKSLPVPHGGAVRVNDPSLVAQQPQMEPPPAEGFEVAHWSIEAHWVARLGVLGEVVNKTARQFRRFGFEPLKFPAGRIEMQADHVAAPLAPPTDNSDPHISFDPATKDWSASRLTAFIARHADHDRIKKRRRDNFELLADTLRGSKHLELLYPEMPEGVCPLGLPIIVDDAAELHTFLEEHGVKSDLFWKTSHDKSPGAEFPDAQFLRQHIVMLPIHQEVDEKSLRLMARRLRQWENMTQNRV